MATKLKSFFIKNFSLGYNSYAQSKTLIKDEEFAYAQNVELDDNGSAQKRPGSRRYGPMVVSGKATMGMGQFKNTVVNAIVVAAGSSWYGYTTLASVALTGTTFTDSLPTDFCQAIDRWYGANGADPLAYTTDGSTITSVTSNGNVGRWPVFFSGRIFMTNTAFPDRIYYSNTVTLNANPATGFASGYFGTFDTDLTANPKKNAGFLQIQPGGGVVITKLFVDGDSGGADALFAYTERHGIYKVGTPSVDATAGFLTFPVSHTNAYFGTTAGRSVVKVANDQEFYGGDNQYSLGEVALYNNVRVSTKSGRVKSEMQGIPAAARKNFANAFFRTGIYSAYTSGSYNDRMIVRNNVLNAYGAPRTGISSSCMFEFVDTDGTRRLLSGSANPSDPYVYELEAGTDDGGTAISAYFETKSTDLGFAGLVKRLGFVKVYYALLYGTLQYEVFADETSSVTGSLTLGSSATGSAGMGTQPFGTFPMGIEYTAGSAAASQAVNDVLTIPCNYISGKRFSVRFTNSNLGEQFKINGVSFHFLPGSIYEV
jgi:hypothetical protein